jgi:hypothetical protein
MEDKPPTPPLELEEPETDNLIKELEELKGENESQDVLIDNIMQIKNSMLPYLKSKMEHKMIDRLKIQEIKFKK